MKKNKKSLLYLFSLILTALLLSISWQLSQSQGTSSRPTLKYDTFPAINLPQLSEPSKRFTTDMFQGHVSLVNIWASWCSACQSEQSILMIIKKQYTTPIYGINYTDNLEDAKMWLKKEGNPYAAIGTDVNGTLADILDINGIPETFLLDKQGKIRYRYNGALSKDTWERIFLPIIEQLAHEQ